MSERFYAVGDHEVMMDVPDGAMLTNVVVIGHVQSVDGREATIVTWPNTTSGVTANGLIFGAYHAHANIQGIVDGSDQ